MIKVFIKQKMSVNKLLVFIITIMLVAISCRNSSQGFDLQKFEVSNPKLDSLINILTREYKKNCKEEKKIIVLEFLVKDSIPEFWFSFHEKNELRDFYIFYQNRRIIGYLKEDDIQIILLSRIDYKNEFEEVFCKFIYPTEKKEKFDYIYFPGDQYKMNEEMVTEDRGIVKVNRWPEVFGFHDYGYYQFKYINNNFVNQ